MSGLAEAPADTSLEGPARESEKVEHAGKAAAGAAASRRPGTPSVRRLMPLLLVAISYYAGAKLGLALTFAPHPVATLWPPNAILIAALLLSPRSRWASLLLAAFPAHLAAELHSGVPIAMVLCWFVSNCSEALIAAWGLGFLIKDPVRFDNVRHVGLYVACGALFATFASSFLDVAFVKLNGWGSGGFWFVWQMRFFSNALGALTIVPMILTWGSSGLDWRRVIPTARCVEVILLSASLLVVCDLVLTAVHKEPATNPAALYAALPFLLWAAVRFGPRGTTASLLVVTLWAIWGATHELGPFTTLSPEQNARSVQLFLIVVSVPLLALTAVMCERRMAEESARERGELFRLTLDAAKMGTWDWNLATGKLSCSSESKRILGLPDVELVNPLESFYRIIDPLDLAAVVTAITQSVEGGAPYDIEFRITQPDGSVRWIMDKGKVSFDASGRPARMVGLHADVTERRQAEEARKGAERSLKESEERMALAALAANLGFLTWDLPSDRMWASEHCRAICGLTPDAELNPARLAACIVPEDRKRVMDAFKYSIATGEPYDAQYRVRTGSRAFRWVRAKGNTDFNAAGEPVRLSGIVIDVTAHQRAEIELQEQRRELTHLARVVLLGELSGALAHELNQPLTAIIANGHVAQRLLQRPGLDTPLLEEVLSDIVYDGERAADVIRQLRRLLKKDNAQLEPLDLSIVSREVLAIAHSDFIIRDITVTSSFAPDLPRVQGDHVQLQQVLLNLILNACDAMQHTAAKRHLHVSCQFVGSEVQVSVCDSGIGVPEGTMDRIFEPFFTSKVDGLGLGLSICRTIVLKHNGRLWAENNSRQGATFHLALSAIMPLLARPREPSSSDRREDQPA